MFLSLLATLLVTVGAKTIVEVAQGTGNHTVLVEAVTKANLADTLSGAGPFTVFAPTDQAFTNALEALGLTKKQLLDKPDLAEILKYHVLSGKVLSTALKPEQSPATVQGAKVAITKAAKVKFADAEVTLADVEASNGVVHVIDKVVLPPTIVDIVKSSADHTVLVEAVVKANLADTLSGAGPFTVFAPTDQAFTNALKALNLTKEELLDKSDLADILKYHVLSGKVLSTDLEATQSPATVQGAEVTITKDGSEVKFADASVSTADIVAGNGVIHVIDKVVLPPAGDSTSVAGDSTSVAGDEASGAPSVGKALACAVAIGTAVFLS
jgi:transforming growth factor-beta-induced protein